MPVLRLLHLSLALLIPALVAITWGSLLRLRGHSQQSIVMAMSRLVGKLGPCLAGTPIQVEHPEHLNPQPAVLIFNHQSGLDPVIVAALLPRSGFAALGVPPNADSVRSVTDREFCALDCNAA